MYGQQRLPVQDRFEECFLDRTAESLLRQVLEQELNAVVWHGEARHTA
jgi:hypothetical protein